MTKRKLQTWTAEEKFILQTHYLSGAEFAKMLNRPVKQVYYQASRMGIRLRPPYVWTKEEMHILSENYPHMPASELAKLLPGRTEHAINARACEFGIKKTHYYRSQHSIRINRRISNRGHRRGCVCVHIETGEVFQRVTDLAKSINTCVCWVSHRLAHSNGRPVKIKNYTVAYLRDLTCGQCQNCTGISCEERDIPFQMCGCGLDSRILETSSQACINFKFYKKHEQ